MTSVFQRPRRACLTESNSLLRTLYHVCHFTNFISAQGHGISSRIDIVKVISSLHNVTSLLRSSLALSIFLPRNIYENVYSWTDLHIEAQTQNGL